MKARLFYPESVERAEIICRDVDEYELGKLSTTDFMRVWCSVVYLNPGLHTDNFHDPEYNCVTYVHSVLAEAWRRSDAGELTEEELYPASIIHARLSAA